MIKLLSTLPFILLLGCASTPPIRDIQGHLVEGSIALSEDVKLGGIGQRILIRGASLKNPMLIVLHGGPGVSETALFRHYNGDLENLFTVVYWDQPGTGRSYSADIPPEAMTVSSLVNDLHELVQLMQQRYAVRKVVLVGHSWGSALGLLYTDLHPDNVAAYIGVGQIASLPKGEELSYQFAVEQAHSHGNQMALRALSKIGPPPHSVDQLLISRHWVEEFGGTFGGDVTQNSLLWAALWTDEMGLKDFWLFKKGMRFSLDAMWPELRGLDLTGKTDFKVPIFFLLGRKDWVTPSCLAESYFETIHAPFKKLIWLEKSGHFGLFEESQKFQDVLLNDVYPLLMKTQ